MRAIFYRCVRVVEHALSVRREYMMKDAQILHRPAGLLRPARRDEALPRLHHSSLGPAGAEAAGEARATRA
jgi:hypothetical protein